MGHWLLLDELRRVMDEERGRGIERAMQQAHLLAAWHSKERERDTFRILIGRGLMHAGAWIAGMPGPQWAELEQTAPCESC